MVTLIIQFLAGLALFFIKVQSSNGFLLAYHMEHVMHIITSVFAGK